MSYKVSYSTGATACATRPAPVQIAPAFRNLRVKIYGNQPFVTSTASGMDVRCEPGTGRIAELTDFDKSSNCDYKFPVPETVLMAVKPYFAKGCSAAETARMFLRPGTNRPRRGFSNRKLDDAWAIFRRAERVAWLNEADDFDVQPGAARVVEFG